jgi:hypothetical protein
MPKACEMRAVAWRRMKEGGFWPILAGFALVFLLGALADTAIRRFGAWQGWIWNMPVLDFLDQLGIAYEPEMEQLLATATIPYVEPGYRIAAAVAHAMWEGILAFGGAVLAIAVMRGGATAFQAFSGFRWPIRTAALGFLRALLVFLWSLLLLVPGVIASYSYRMAFLLLADHPDWSPWRAIQESKRMMRGHRWRLACLDASFIGWFLLVAVTFGLAGLFVTPYFATANAAFYEDLLDRTGN